MHIPDGLLNRETLLITGALSAGALTLSLKRLSGRLSYERIPLIGILAAFVFAVQLLAFPVVGGTSMHLTGGLLASILLGPHSGLIVISSALILQSLLFQHGGILTLGANILNIGIVNCYIGYLIYRIFPEKILWAGISSGISIVTGAFLCGMELTFSNRLPLHGGLVVMPLTHIVAGFIEGFVTVWVLITLKKVRPDLLMLEKI